MPVTDVILVPKLDTVSQMWSNKRQVKRNNKFPQSACCASVDAVKCACWPSLLPGRTSGLGSTCYLLGASGPFQWSYSPADRIPDFTTAEGQPVPGAELPLCLNFTWFLLAHSASPSKLLWMVALLLRVSDALPAAPSPPAPAWRLPKTQWGCIAVVELYLQLGSR